MPSVRLVNKNGQVRNFPLSEEDTTIGRSDDNDIVLPGSTVSRKHARIEKTKEGYLLSDLGSRNGTEVNQKPTRSTFLKHQDQIEIGPNRLIFIAEEEPRESPDGSPVLTVSSLPSEAASEHAKITEDLSSMGRSNKVLFVLYEISRHLTSIQDFNELLEKIMDLIFMVIDADRGYLFLIGDTEEAEPVPKVVKYKDDLIKDGEPLGASQTILNKVINEKVALLTANAMEDPELDRAQSILMQQIRTAMCVPLWRRDKVIGAIQLDSKRLDNQFTRADLELLNAIGSQMAMIIEQASLNEQIRKEERMMRRLRRYFSPQVIETILKGGAWTQDDIMEPRELTATVLFTDIVGFTHLSEQMPPKEINMFLNRHFHRMADIVFQYGGTLDKYLGDGLMAVFGAPMEKEDDAERAIQAARQMREELKKMRDQTGVDAQFDIRIGINTGRVVAGNIGSPNRVDYTVIGDPVNVASRLESIAQPNQILIGEETFRHVKGLFDIKKVGPKKVKGKGAEIMVYAVY
ncbi:MAG: adenylate/guanylate cyclase domain-containing protein [Desulfobacteraceae bacterium]|jgi:adenylate cyclase